MEIKLLLTYERNQTNTSSLDRINKTPNYYKELNECIFYWRKNAGILKNIEIIIHSDVNLDFNDKNIKVIVKPFRKLLKSNYGFVNVHETGLLAHSLYDCTFIHIDLDMYIQRELPMNIFENNCIGVYSLKDEKVQRKKLFGKYLVETDFIISKNNFFYKEYFKYYNCIKKICAAKKCNDYDVEEYVADFILDKHKINVFKDYEIGQGFLCDVKNPYFIHQHLY